MIVIVRGPNSTRTFDAIVTDYEKDSKHLFIETISGKYYVENVEAVNDPYVTEFFSASRIKFHDSNRPLQDLSWGLDGIKMSIDAILSFLTHHF